MWWRDAEREYQAAGSAKAKQHSPSLRRFAVALTAVKTRSWALEYLSRLLFAAAKEPTTF